MGAQKGRGMGGPATAGKRWPHFFQMGKLRHKEVWELAQVTHSESAFGGAGSSHPKKHGPGILLPSTLGSGLDKKGLRAWDYVGQGAWPQESGGSW